MPLDGNDSAGAGDVRGGGAVSCADVCDDVLGWEISAFC